MGCLNADQNFDHCFGNIHLSGPCNRSCYFCIGQYMPGQDMNNNLSGEIDGLDSFIEACKKRKVTEVNITGTNTDPLMRDGLIALCLYLRFHGITNIGIRTNGVRIGKLIEVLPYIDKVSISITSFDPDLYKKTMGQGTPPDLDRIKQCADHYEVDMKLNVVLCPETAHTRDLLVTLNEAHKLGIKRVNLREPYGQMRIGNPLALRRFHQTRAIYGNPVYQFGSGAKAMMDVTYWDVHYTQVDSINLYADGTVSTDYAVSLGHSKEFGDVKDQSNFGQGRQQKQWVGTKMETAA